MYVQTRRAQFHLSFLCSLVVSAFVLPSPALIYTFFFRTFWLLLTSVLSSLFLWFVFINKYESFEHFEGMQVIWGVNGVSKKSDYSLSLECPPAVFKTCYGSEQPNLNSNLSNFWARYWAKWSPEVHSNLILIYNSNKRCSALFWEQESHHSVNSVCNIRVILLALLLGKIGLHSSFKMEK